MEESGGCWTPQSHVSMCPVLYAYDVKMSPNLPQTRATVRLRRHHKADTAVASSAVVNLSPMKIACWFLGGHACVPLKHTGSNWVRLQHLCPLSEYLQLCFPPRPPVVDARSFHCRCNTATLRVTVRQKNDQNDGTAVCLPPRMLWNLPDTPTRPACTRETDPLNETLRQQWHCSSDWRTKAC